MILELYGKDIENLDNESGGLRTQRVSPTEKRGRVHTSTVTIAVINPVTFIPKNIPDKEFKIIWFSGTGKGGQKRNKKQSSCRVTHINTGIMETRQGRSRVQNLESAKEAIKNRINNNEKDIKDGFDSLNRQKLMGSGMRGDKIRTIRFQDNIVLDHRNNKRMKAKEFMKGNMDLLW